MKTYFGVLPVEYLSVGEVKQFGRCRSREVGVDSDRGRTLAHRHAHVETPDLKNDHYWLRYHQQV